MDHSIDYFNNYDWIEYNKFHQDLKNIDDIIDAYNHYIHIGIHEKRKIFEKKKKKDYNISNSNNNDKVNIKDEIIQELPIDLNNKANSKEQKSKLIFKNLEEEQFFKDHDWSLYLKTHNDLKQHNIITLEDAYLHYKKHGQKENRKIYKTNEKNNEKKKDIVKKLTTLSFENKDEEIFFINHNWYQYLKTHNDLIQHNINTPQEAYIHYKNHGKQEGRVIFKLILEDGETISSYQEFIQKNNKIKQQNINFLKDKLKSNDALFYFKNKEDIDLYINYDWIMYLNIHDDLKQHNIKTVNDAYLHYINHGKNENRTLFKLIFDDQNNNDQIIDEIYELINNENQGINCSQEEKKKEEYEKLLKEQKEKEELIKNHIEIKSKNKELLSNKQVFEKLNLINNKDIDFFINHDWTLYLNTHADLKKHNINTIIDAYLHYIDHGKNENREIFSLFVPCSNEETLILNKIKNNNIQKEHNSQEKLNIVEEHNYQKEHCTQLENNITQESPMEKQIPMIMENDCDSIYNQNKDKDFYDNHDWNRYLIDNNDLFKKGIQTEIDAYYHYLSYGQSEERILHKKINSNINNDNKIKIMNKKKNNTSIHDNKNNQTKNLSNSELLKQFNYDYYSKMNSDIENYQNKFYMSYHFLNFCEEEERPYTRDDYLLFINYDWQKYFNQGKFSKNKNCTFHCFFKDIKNNTIKNQEKYLKFKKEDLCLDFFKIYFQIKWEISLDDAFLYYLNIEEDEKIFLNYDNYLIYLLIDWTYFQNNNSVPISNFVDYFFKNYQKNQQFNLKFQFSLVKKFIKKEIYINNHLHYFKELSNFQQFLNSQILYQDQTFLQNIVDINNIFMKITQSISLIQIPKYFILQENTKEVNKNIYTYVFTIEVSKIDNSLKQLLLSIFYQNYKSWEILLLIKEEKIRNQLENFFIPFQIQKRVSYYTISKDNSLAIEEMMKYYSLHKIIIFLPLSYQLRSSIFLDILSSQLLESQYKAVIYDKHESEIIQPYFIVCNVNILKQIAFSSYFKYNSYTYEEFTYLLHYIFFQYCENFLLNWNKNNSSIHYIPPNQNNEIQKKKAPILKDKIDQIYQYFLKNNNSIQDKMPIFIHSSFKKINELFQYFHKICIGNYELIEGPFHYYTFFTELNKFLNQNYVIIILNKTIMQYNILALQSISLNCDLFIKKNGVHYEYTLENDKSIITSLEELVVDACCIIINKKFRDQYLKFNA